MSVPAANRKVVDLSPLLLTGGRVLDPASGLDAVADVLLRGGRIAAVGAGLKVRPGGDHQVRRAVMMRCSIQSSVSLTAWWWRDPSIQ